MAKMAYRSAGFWKKLGKFCETAQVPQTIVDSVAKILADVRSEGDEGIRQTLARIDRIDLEPDRFAITDEEMKAALKRLPAEDRAAIKEAISSVTEFHAHALPRDWSSKNGHGATIGERFYPLDRVGLYIPTGLASTVVMTAALAKLARVPEIVAFTPCGPGGVVHDGVLAAMKLAGVTEAYRVGGVCAIGAMAYGTKRIRPVDKVFGPGNAFTVEAKRQVFGQIGVDLLPGPSELMVIADASANARFVAADLSVLSSLSDIVRPWRRRTGPGGARQGRNGGVWRSWHRICCDLFANFSTANP